MENTQKDLEKTALLITNNSRYGEFGFAEDKEKIQYGHGWNCDTAKLFEKILEDRIKYHKINNF